MPKIPAKFSRPIKYLGVLNGLHAMYVAENKVIRESDHPPSIKGEMRDNAAALKWAIRELSKLEKRKAVRK